MKTKILILIAAILSLLYYWENKEHNELDAIAILQTAPHPSLDLIRENFKQHFIENHQEPIEWIEQNGMGQISSLQAMAQSLHHNKKVKLILTIGTPATQVMAMVEKKIPIVYSAVTDPSILGKEALNQNICGLSDGVDAKEQVNALLKLWPEAKKVSILYNPSESNSQKAVEAFCKALENKGLNASLCAALTPAEIPSAATLACRLGDVVFVPADNLVAMTLPLISQICHKSKTHLIAGYSTAINEGADASIGISYSQMGKMAAQISLDILYKNLSPSLFETKSLPYSLQITDQNSLNKHQREKE